MTQETTETSTTDTPTYADAIERGSAALMFREPQLARTTKTARAIVERVVDALVTAGITRESVVKPAVAQQEALDVSA